MPASLPLVDIWTLLALGLAPSQVRGRVERDTTNDVTDEQIAELM